MLTGRVIGTVVATGKLENLRGVRLLVVQPVDSEQRDYGRPFVAADSIGAACGELVCCAKSREGAMTLPDPGVCVDAGVSAIIDSIYCP